jgi:hypothetical protein
VNVLKNERKWKWKQERMKAQKRIYMLTISHALPFRPRFQ